MRSSLPGSPGYFEELPASLCPYGEAIRGPSARPSYRQEENTPPYRTEKIRLNPDGSVKAGLFAKTIYVIGKALGAFFE